MMQDSRNKLKRQLEILGIILSQDYSGLIRTFDLAEMFRVEELTIMRDLQQLRSFGIDIHSTKKEGISIEGKIEDEKLREFIQQYSSLCIAPSFVDKSTSLLVSRLGEKSLANLVVLQLSIEQNRVVQIDYEKENGMLDFAREICPILIFQRENYWRVLASFSNSLRQFHLNKILEARTTYKSFNPVQNERLEDVFRYTWKSWIGENKYDVKLHFTKLWAERIKPKQLMDIEKFTEDADGSVTYETTVNSLDEIASWIVSRGKGVIVLEPAELKEKVLNLAKEALSNYD